MNKKLLRKILECIEDDDPDFEVSADGQRLLLGTTADGLEPFMYCLEADDNGLVYVQLV